MLIAILVSFVKLLAVAFTLGIGFWLSRQFTGLIDELLISLQRKKLQRLTAQLNSV